MVNHSVSHPSIKMSQHHQPGHTNNQNNEQRSREPVPACDMSRDDRKKDVLAELELNTLDYVRAPGGSVKWWREKGEQRAHGFCLRYQRSQNAPRPTKNALQEGKKGNKGKRGRGSCCRTQLRHVPMQRGLGSPWYIVLSLSRLDIAGSAQL